MKNEYFNLDYEQLLDQIPRNQGGFVYKFLIDDREFYFKECLEEHALLEKMGSYIARCISIPTVEYDLVSYHGKKGVGSFSYNPNHLEEITIYEILSHYYINCLAEDSYLLEDVKDFNALYNLDDIWNALDFYYKERNNKFEIVKSLMHEIVDAFFLQLILGNRDLHYTQLTILNSDFPHLSIQHDYSLSCLIQLKNNFYPYALQMTMKDTNKEYPRDTILEFINSSDNSLLDYFSEKLNNLPNREMILSFIGKEHEHKMSFFLNNYESYCDFLKKTISEKKGKSL